MEKKKSLTTKIYISILILLLISVIILSSFQSTASATTDGDEQARGVFTKISLSIGFGNGYVWAKAKNDFTLGYSEVKVYLELYSSAEYQTDINNMHLENTNSIDDLNIYKSIETMALTNGETRYWQAAKSVIASVWLFDKVYHESPHGIGMFAQYHSNKGYVNGYHMYSFYGSAL